MNQTPNIVAETPQTWAEVNNGATDGPPSRSRPLELHWSISGDGAVEK